MTYSQQVDSLNVQFQNGQITLTELRNAIDVIINSESTMTYSPEIQQLLAKKGQIATITTQRDMKMRKGQPVVQKKSTFQCRIGVNYDNIAAVKEKREEGVLPAENAGLPWGEWLEFPHLITHKGEVYIRCTPLRNDFIPRTSFFLDGYEVSKDAVIPMCLASEFKDDRSNDAFNIRASSILEVK